MLKIKLIQLAVDIDNQFVNRRLEPIETGQTEPLFVTTHPSEFILDIADLTGELMRNAINALGAGNIEVTQPYLIMQV